MLNTNTCSGASISAKSANAAPTGTTNFDTAVARTRDALDAVRTAFAVQPQVEAGATRQGGCGGGSGSVRETLSEIKSLIEQITTLLGGDGGQGGCGCDQHAPRLSRQFGGAVRRLEAQRERDQSVGRDHYADAFRLLNALSTALEGLANAQTGASQTQPQRRACA